MNSDINQNQMKDRLNEIWKDDLLERRVDADLLQKFLLSRTSERLARGEKNSYVMNVDADWGQGKTFFLNRFARQLREYGYVVAEVDAWKDDHAEDPLLPVISAIDASISPFLVKKEDVNQKWRKIVKFGSNVALSIAKETGMHWFRRLSGLGLDQVKALVDSGGLTETAQAGAKGFESAVEKQFGSIIDSFNNNKILIETFKSSFAEFINDKGNFSEKLPVFIFIDEIDRCRPTFAVQLLERVKHIFESDGCVFITSANIDQLRHSICAIYGGGFDSRRYLYRFFDRSYKFTDPEMLPFVSSIVKTYAISTEKIRLPSGVNFGNYISDGIMFYGLTPRDAKQCLDIIRSFITIWDRELPIEICLLFPLAVSEQQGIKASITRSIYSELSNLRESRGDKSIKWEIKFGSREKFSGAQIFDRIIKLLDKSLNDILHERYDENSSYENWMRSYFVDEYNYNVNNKISRDERSILSYYWNMVRSVGRLS